MPTKRLNEQYRRNLDRFPEDFAFELTQDEWAALRSQLSTLEAGGGIRSQFATASKRNIRYLPIAFTEHGALMAANILNSPRAVAMSVYVSRPFGTYRAGRAHPALKRWAILVCPSGTGAEPFGACRRQEGKDHGAGRPR